MKKLHILLSLLIVFTSTLLFTACFGEKPPPETFSISGYVYDGEVGVEGVSLISDVGTVQTDENGYYSFKGLTSGITITAEKENYMFIEKTKTFFTKTESANFIALPYYSIQGFIKSGEVGVEGVKITATGYKGGFTYSTTNGAFVLYNVAGEVKLTAEKQGYVFFEKTINKSNATDVVINATTSISGLVEFVGKSIECQDLVKVFVGEDEVSLNDAKFSVSNIKLGTIIKPVGTDFVFEPQQIVVMQENQVVEFKCQKLFDFTGFVKSGDYAIANAQIKCGEQIVESKEDGSFILTNLVGSVEIEVTHNDFVFEKITVSETNNTYNFIGTKSVKGEVVFANSPLKNVEVKCGANTTYTNNLGKFILDNVCVGDEIELLFDGYKLEPNKLFVTAESQYVIVLAAKIYDAQIVVESESGEALSDVIVSIGGQQYNTNSEGFVEIKSIIGEYDIICEKQGYFIECVEKLSYLNSEITIVAKPYYDAHIRLHSGSTVLTHTICSVDGVEYTSDENGEFVIENLIEGQQCEVYCEGYNSQNIIFDINNNIIDVNLSYSISGVIISGSAYVDNAKIFNDSVEVFSNREGKFVIDSLYGENFFSVEKLDYIFENGFSVSSEKFDIVIDSTYSIYGIAKNETDFLADIDIILTNYETEQSQTIKTDENGRYVFSGVTGYNLLFYSTSLNLKLRPSSYDVSQSGQYDFMLNGFELGGTVLCGGVGVEGVLMSAGSNKTYTDKNGYYYFSLLTSDCSIVAQKQGYVFTPNTINVTSDDNARTDINFVATYKVEGTVYCGQQKVSDVKVSIGDKVTYTNVNGYFEISGISQKSPIILEKENYQFECQEYVDSYCNLVVQSNFSITGIVKSGDVLIDGATIKYNDKEIETKNGGLFVIDGLVSPTKIYVSKLGYDFESEYIVTQPTDLEINSTYSITGIVKSSNAPISGVSVKYNNQIITTDDFGMFKLSGLVGTVAISFEKEGYIFEDEIVSMPCDLQIYATFSVDGRIILNGVGLADVQVSCQGKSTTTDANGYFVLSGLSGEGNLELIRRGYTFDGETYFEKSTTLNFIALYSLVGKVYSGDLLLKDVQVLVGETEVLTKEDGSFEIIGLSDSVSVVYKKNGYNQVTKNYSDFSDDIVIDMSYNITIKLVGNTGTEATVTIKDYKETKTLKTKEQSLSVTQIFGNTIISFEKQGYMFVPAQIGISGPGIVSTTLSAIYTINGKVTVEGTSIPVIGMKLSAGGQSVYTNAKGEYSITNLMGTVTLVGQLEYAGCTTISTESKQISGTGEYNFSVTASQYAYFLFERGYKLLDNAQSSYVTVEGKLSLTMGGDQTIRGTRKRDSKGNIFTEKINYGDTVLSIDPKVSLLTYYNINTREVKIQQTKAVSDKYIPTYGSYTDSSVDAYKTKYGVYPYDNYAYIINQSTVSSITGLSYSDGKTVFTMNLNANTSITNYKIQMTALSGQTPNKFNHIKLTYTIDNNGYINTLDIDEQYVITVGLSVTATASIRETFLVRDANTVLTDVDINDIRGSLTYQEKPMAASNVLLPQVTQFDSKRRKR